MTANNRYKSDYSSCSLNPSLNAELSGPVHYEIKLGFNVQDEPNEIGAKILEKTPTQQTDADIYYGQGDTFLEQGNLNAAIESYRQALAINPDFAEAYSKLGIALRNRGELDAAVDCFHRAIAIAPDLVEAYYKLGSARQAQGNLNAAIESFRKTVALQPDHVNAHYNLGVLFQAQNELDLAAEHYRAAIAIAPNDAEAHNNLGLVLEAQGNLEEAGEHLHRAVALKPTYVNAHCNLGGVLQKQRNLDAAAEHCRKALALQPDCIAAHINQGIIFQKQNRLDAALASYRQAITLSPDNADAAEVYNNLGNAFLGQRQFNAAIDAYRKAISLKPDYAQAHACLGSVFMMQSIWDAAEASLQRALDLKPKFPEALCTLFHVRQRLCKWEKYAEHTRTIISEADAGGIDPLIFMSLSHSVEEQLRCAQARIVELCQLPEAPLWAGRRYRHDKIRIAYVSADFQNHPVSLLMADMLERHDPKRFETVAISLRPEDRSPIGQRVARAFGRFIDISQQSDYEAASLMREMEIDIAVDLMGFTSDSRPNIFAHRPAPIQINYLGYSGTVGAEHIDYIIADKHVIPPEHQAYYTEKVVYLPDTYMATDSAWRIAKNVPSRKELDLPDDSFVFCCFNHNYKITPDIFDIWMRLLGSVKNSVLWLPQSNAIAMDNLRKEAAMRGIAPERLIFASYAATHDQHLARLKAADLFLDTLPYNAHTTSVDALWVGLPVLTCLGGTFAGRVAASLLNAVGLPELVADDLAEYEALALKIAATPALLSEIRAKLSRNRSTYPLFDTGRFYRHIEAAFITMWERRQRGEQPASFTVPRYTV